MKSKKRFRWSEKTERSVAEIVTEDGALRQKDVIGIAERLCSQTDSLSPGKNAGRKTCIYPNSVIVNIYGDIRIEETECSLSAMEPYLPPELSPADSYAPDVRVYAIGMLMLYMATGKETKAEMNTGSLSRTLFSLIQRCTSFDPKERFSDTKALMAALRQESGTGRKVRTVLSVICIFCIAAALVFFFGREGMIKGGASGDKTGYRSGFSAGFEQGFSDMPGIGINAVSLDVHNGNLSGNLISDNGPFAVSGEDAVFYLTGENLCRMDPYTKGTEVMAVVSDAHALQYCNGHLYYCRGESLCSMNVKTAEEKVICESAGMKLYLFNDTLYLYDSDGTGYLYRVDTEKGTRIQLNGAASYHCLNIVDGRLYYISPENGHSLCRSDIDGGNQSVISSGAYESMCVYNGSIIAVTDDGMIRMDLNGSSPENLLSHPVYDPNVSDGGIFYVSRKGRTLEWMSLDGRTRFTVVATGTGSFNVTGQWIFYQNEEDGGRLWRVRIGGSDNVRVSQ